MTVSSVKTSNAKTAKEVARDQIPMKVTAQDARDAIARENARRSKGKVNASDRQAALARERAGHETGLSTDQLRMALANDKKQAKARRLNITA